MDVLDSDDQGPVLGSSPERVGNRPEQRGRVQLDQGSSEVFGFRGFIWGDELWKKSVQNGFVGTEQRLSMTSGEPGSGEAD